MASSRRTYDTDVITLRTVFAKNPGNSNVPALRTLTADGQGGTYWAVPSTLGVNPAFNQIITSGGTYTADLSYNTFRLTAAENIGMTDGPPGSNQTYLYAKAFSQFDVSGENSVYAFLNNQLDSSVTFAGQGGITLRADPATNTLFFVGPASNSYTVSTGIYGFNQIKVVDAASTITSSIQGWNGSYLTATSPSTLLNFIGYNDIQMSTNTTTNSIFFKISTFTSQGYLDISAAAFSAYPSTLSTVSSLYVQQSVFNSTVGYLSSYTGFGFSSVVSSINALAMSTGNQFYILTGLIDEKATIIQLNSYSNAITNEMFSTTAGLGTLGYISTGGGGVIGSAQLISTVEGLGSAGYLSTVGGIIGNITTENVVSTVQGLGTVGYVSSLSTITTSSIFNTGAISTYSLEVFGPATLTNSGSTILRGPIYLGGPTFIAGSLSGAPNTLVTPTNLNSTVQGLGTSRYISSSQLLSTVAGLGSLGYLSSLRGFAISSGSVTASSINLLDPYTNAVNYLTVSSGSLLVNGAKIEGGGGGGGGGVAQIVAGTGINVTPAGGTGVVTITNTGATTSYVDTAISSFSTALGPLSQGGGSYNFSTVSSVYGSNFVTNLLTASTMTTANILPSQSNLWVSVGYGSSATNSIQTSTDGLSWTDAVTGGFSSAGKGIAYSGSLWVAVGNNGSATGSIQYSGDGKNWSNATTGGFSSGGNGIAWNGSYWIAVGNNGSATTSIQISRDGRNWSGINSGGFSVRGEGVAWNGSYWVSVGLGASQLAGLQYSLDGLTWISATSGGFSAGGKGIAWNGSLWVAAGDDTTRPASLQYSGDGKNWSNATTGGFLSAAWKVAWNGKLWVAVGDEGSALKSIQTSLDGSNWTDIQSGGFSAGNDGYGIAWNGFYWIATGIGASAANSIQRSFDGVNWTSALTGGFSLGAVSVGFSSNLTPGYAQQGLTILSQNIPLFLNSTNTIMAQPSSLLINNTLLVDGKFNRLGVNCNTPAYSLDVNGIGHFLSLSTLGLQISSINGVAYNDAGSITSTVAGLGQNYVSTSGLVSTTRGLQTSGFLSTSALVSTTYGLQTSGFLSTSVIASTVAGLGQNYISSLINVNTLSSLALNVSSINGALPGTGSGNGSSITVSTGQLYASSMSFVNVAQSSNAMWVAVGNDYIQAVKYSYDGINWSNAAGSQVFDGAGLGVAWNGRMWVAVGNDSIQNVKYSYDGINWSNAAGSPVFDNVSGRGVVWNGRIWVAVGDDTTQCIKYSTDGINWSNAAGSQVFNGGGGYGVAWNGRMWVAVGTDNIQCVKYSYNGINWSNAAGSQVFDSFSGFGVAWNGRMWVAVGNDSIQNVKYSYDGINWLPAAGSPVFDNLFGRGVAWNGRMWVAVGGDSTQCVKYSYNGINWSNAAGSQVFDDPTGYGVAWNGRMWVAVGVDTTQCVKYSYNGINWLPAAGSSVFNNLIGTGVAYSSNVVPSYNQTNFEIEPQNIPNFLTSTNQLSFLPSTIIANNTLFVDTTNKVGINTGAPQTDLDVNGTGRFNTVSTQAFNLSSINGANFPLILPSTVAGLGQNYLSSLINVITLSSLVLNVSSINGALPGTGSGNGSSISVSTGKLYASSISFINLEQPTTNLWVAVGIAGPTIVYSSNASSWTPVGFSDNFFNAGYGVAWNGRLWVAVGQDSTAANTIKYSYNGVNWSNSSSGGFSSAGRGIGWNGTIWIAVGNGGSTAASIKYSYDGINWTNSSSGGFTGGTGGTGVAWNGKLWVAVGDSDAAIGSIKYSYDGINWSNNANGGFTTEGNCIAWNGRIWLAGGGDGAAATRIQYSTDGINWTNGNNTGFLTSGGCRGVAWNGRLWVAVGLNGISAGSIKYSFDGINWSDSASGGFTNGAYGVSWNGKFWVATGNNGGTSGSLQYSADGINWTNTSGLPNGGFGVGYSLNPTPSYNQTNFEIEPQNIPVFLRSTNTMSFMQSSIITNNTLFVDTTNKVGINTGAPQTDLDVYGTGRFLTASTLALNISSINGAVYAGGNVVTANLVSTTVGIWSNPTFPSTVSTSYALSFTTSSIRNVSSITFGSGGAGWVTMGGMQAVIISSIQQNTAVSYISSLYVGSTNVLTLPFYTAQINGTASISSLLVGQAINPFSTIGFRLAITHDSAIKPGTTTWTTTSDMRMKDNIISADFDRCYNDVKALQLRRFTWQSSFINSWGGTDKRVLGFVAQEVSTIVPKAVTIMNAYGYDDFQFLNTDQLNMSLFGAVKKMIQDKEYLESTVKGQVFELETLKGTTTIILSTLKGIQNQ